MAGWAGGDGGGWVEGVNCSKRDTSSAVFGSPGYEYRLMIGLVLCVTDGEHVICKLQFPN